MCFTLLAICAFALAWRVPTDVQAQSLASPTYTPAQATAGRAAYAQSCASCHGANLDDGEFAPPLKGTAFQQQWGGKSADNVFDYVETKMPPGQPGSLGDVRYAEVLAFLLQQNGVAPGTRALPADAVALRAIVMPARRLGPAGASLPASRCHRRRRVGTSSRTGPR